MEPWRNLSKKDQERLIFTGVVIIFALGLLGLAYFNLSPSLVKATSTPGCLSVNAESMQRVFELATERVNQAATIVANYAQGLICHISTSTQFPIPRSTPLPPGTIIGSN